KPSLNFNAFLTHNFKPYSSQAYQHQQQRAIHPHLIKSKIFSGRALKYLTPAYPHLPMPFISQNFQESLPEFFTRRSKSLRRIHDSSKSTSKAPEIPLIERGPRGLEGPSPLPLPLFNFQR
ncbi:hypothetical protein CDAR_456841, partial [Caerostris darwini]